MKKLNDASIRGGARRHVWSDAFRHSFILGVHQCLESCANRFVFLREAFYLCFKLLSLRFRSSLKRLQLRLFFFYCDYKRLQFRLELLCLRLRFSLKRLQFRFFKFTQAVKFAALFAQLVQIKLGQLRINHKIDLLERLDSKPVTPSSGDTKLGGPNP